MHRGRVQGVLSSRLRFNYSHIASLVLGVLVTYVCTRKGDPGEADVNPRQSADGCAVSSFPKPSCNTLSSLRSFCYSLQCVHDPLSMSEAVLVDQANSLQRPARRRLRVRLAITTRSGSSWRRIWRPVPRAVLSCEGMRPCSRSSPHTCRSSAAHANAGSWSEAITQCRVRAGCCIHLKTVVELAGTSCLGKGRQIRIIL